MYLAIENQRSYQSEPSHPDSEQDFTHLQRRAWNVLLANAYNELPRHRTSIRVSVVELARETRLRF